MAKITELAHELAALSEGGSARIALCVGAVRVAEADRAALWEPDADDTGLRLSAHAGVEDRSARRGPRRSRHGGARRLREPPHDHQHRAELLGLVSDPARAAGGGRARARLAGAAGLRTPPSITLAKLLAAETGVTLERIALLEELAMVARTDELTGLPNRRAWQEHVTRELARAQRSGESLAVAMLDLDHFKRYNDTYGHQTGDRLLKQVASAWSSELRATDVLVRYGGEEFALALPARDAAEGLGRG